jgi:hypothetical protein
MKAFLRVLPFLIFASISLNSGAQNLVPNPGFEALNSLPCGFNASPAAFDNMVQNWYTPTQTTPDIATTASSQTCWSHLPNSTYSGLGCARHAQSSYPRTGSATAAITTYNTNSVCGGGGGAWNAWSEYVAVQLTQPMLPGRTYEASMWVMLSGGSYEANNNLGFYFTKDQILRQNICKPIHETPQIVDSRIIASDSQWIEISGRFTPSDTLHYLHIGNFDDSVYSRTSTLQVLTGSGVNSHCYGAMYLIDDVYVGEAPADTCYYAVYDTVTVTAYDTVTVTDSLFVRDTVVVYDTVTVRQFVTVYDTLLIPVCDSISYDSMVLYDTVMVSVEDTLIIDFGIPDGIPGMNTATVKLYPNPVTEMLVIEFDPILINRGYRLRIYDLEGAEVINLFISSPITHIPVQQFWSTGVYFADILHPNGTSITTKKIVIQ